MRAIQRKLIILVTAVLSFCIACKNVTSSSTPGQQAYVEVFMRDGSSFERAVVVNSIEEEYRWVTQRIQSKQLKKQRLVFYRKKPYDILTFILTDGTDEDFYFDVSTFYGKL
jgi:hypothetical protein